MGKEKLYHNKVKSLGNKNGEMERYYFLKFFMCFPFFSASESVINSSVYHRLYVTAAEIWH